MQCSCANVELDYGYATILSDTTQTARKQHKCHECYRAIMPGEKYSVEKMVSEGKVGTHKTCAECRDIRNVLVCNFYYGEVWELLEETYENWDSDLIPWATIAKLTPSARVKLLERIEDAWEGSDFDDEE